MLWRKRKFISLNSLAGFYRKSTKCRTCGARARANHVKNDAQKGCAMQLDGIALISSVWGSISYTEQQIKELFTFSSLF